MTSAFEGQTVSLCRQPGGERRQLLSPWLPSSLIHPFGRWQTGRILRAVSPDPRAVAPFRLPLPKVHVLAPIVPNDRRHLFAVTA
jgi:hypothetical protein